MTAKLNYALTLFNLENIDGAIKEFIELINLNPNDNQGVRHILSGLLLFRKKYKTYYKLYKKYNSDNSTTWLYNNALYLFITEGPSERANKALVDANQANKYVIPMIISSENLKQDLNRFISPGDEDEAIYYLLYNLGGWIMNKKALEWLKYFSEKNIKNNKMKLISPNKD
jgi:tetratricopeptide (TPR) repeat protein